MRRWSWDQSEAQVGALRCAIGRQNEPYEMNPYVTLRNMTDEDIRQNNEISRRIR